MRDEPKQSDALRQAQGERGDINPPPGSDDANASPEPLTRLRPSKNRLLQRSRPPNRKLFDARAKRRFLDVFAATANARMGAEAAGVAYPTVFKHRARDAAFAAAWEDALAQGYARLEAEVLSAALAPSPFGDGDGAPLDFARDKREGRNDREGGDPSDGVGSTALAVEPLPPTVPAMSVEQKLMILREYRRGFGPGRRAPSERPVVASQEEAIAALAKRLATFAVQGRLVVPVAEGRAAGADVVPLAGSPRPGSPRPGSGRAGQAGQGMLGGGLDDGNEGGAGAGD